MILPRSLQVLRERDFRLLISARTVSQLGNQVLPIALAFAVLELTGSPIDLGLVLAAETVALAVFLIVGGTFADRLPRRRVMVAADSVRFVSQSVLAALLITGAAQIWQIVVLQIVGGISSAFFIPAVTAIQPETVSSARLREANALRSVSMAVTGIAGPAIGGVLVVVLQPGYAIAVDALTFAAGAVLVSRIRAGASAVPARDNVIRSLAEGWREFRTRQWLWTVTAQGAVVRMCVLAPFLVLGPVIMLETANGAQSWAVILTALGAGALVGGLLMPRVRVRRPLVAVVAGSTAFAPMVVLVALGAPVVLVAAAAVLAGVEQAVYWTLWQTVMQQRVPAAILSRVSSYDWLGAYACQPLGYALAGTLAGVVGAGAVLWAGAAILIVGAFAVLAVPQVRQLGDEVTADAAG